MDLSYSSEQEEFRRAGRRWLQHNIPPDLPDRGFALPTEEQAVRAHREWQRKLYDAGYLGISWPVEYGGQGRTLGEEAIFNDELVRMRAPMPLNQIGLSIAGPTILAHGTELQKRRFVREILSCGDVWCQGFSEAEAGSDVAALSSRAEFEGDEFVVNGAKLWTSFGYIADWCMLLVRTDRTSARHKGLSYLLVDMKTPGIMVAPLRQITGEREFSEMRFENVRVPRENLLGPINHGWEVAVTALMNERAMFSLAAGARMKITFEDLAALAKTRTFGGIQASRHALVRQQLAQFYIDAESARLLAMRNFSKLLRGEQPGAEGSLAKVMWSELGQRMNDFALQLEGAAAVLAQGSPHAVADGRWQYSALRSRGYTIEQGTSEIQRGIIAERILGMPRSR